MELRNGNRSESAKKAGGANGGLSVRQAMTTDMILDYIGISTDSIAAQDDDLSLNLNIMDTSEHFFIKRVNGVLLVYSGETRDDADCTLSCVKMQLLGMMMGNSDVFSNLTVEGDASIPVRLVKYLTPFSPTFNIVEP